MGDGDRRSGPLPRAGLARLPCRDERPSGPGGDRAAGGHADRDRERRGRAALRADRDPSGPVPDGRTAEAPVGGGAPDRDPRRQPLVARGGAALRALRRALRLAGRVHLPAPDAVSGRPPLLCGRPRPRREPEAAGAHPGRRPRPARRRAALRDPIAELHASRHPGAAPGRSCMSIRTRANSGASIGPILPSTPRRRPSRRRSRALQPPQTIRWSARTSSGPCGLSRLERPRARSAIRARSRWARSWPICARRFRADTIFCNGAGNFATWIHRFWPFRAYGTPARADLGLDGLRAPGRGRREAHPAGPHRRVLCRATATS